MTREGHSREASLLLERLTHAGGFVDSSMRIFGLFPWPLVLLCSALYALSGPAVSAFLGLGAAMTELNWIRESAFSFTLSQLFLRGISSDLAVRMFFCFVLGLILLEGWSMPRLRISLWRI